MAAAYLSDELAVECYLPLATFLRKGAEGKRRTREPLFPGYLFVKVDLAMELRKVKYARGVLGFVQLGDRFPVVSERQIEGLRALCAALEKETEFTAALMVGDTVELVGKLFGGTTGEILELLPAKNRVTVLVEFLNRSVEVSVPFQNVIKSDKQ